MSFFLLLYVLTLSLLYVPVSSRKHVRSVPRMANQLLLRVLHAASRKYFYMLCVFRLIHITVLWKLSTKWTVRRKSMSLDYMCISCDLPLLALPCRVMKRSAPRNQTIRMLLCHRLWKVMFLIMRSRSCAYSLQFIVICLHVLLACLVLRLLLVTTILSCSRHSRILPWQSTTTASLSFRTSSVSFSPSQSIYFFVLFVSRVCEVKAFSGGSESYRTTYETKCGHLPPETKKLVVGSFIIVFMVLAFDASSLPGWSLKPCVLKDANHTSTRLELSLPYYALSAIACAWPMTKQRRHHAWHCVLWPELWQRVSWLRPPHLVPLSHLIPFIRLLSRRLNKTLGEMLLFGD